MAHEKTPDTRRSSAHAYRAAGFALAAVATVVDLPQGAANLAAFAEARRQVAFADIVILSKQAQAPRAEAEALAALVAGINPGAEIRTALAGSGVLADPPAPRDRRPGSLPDGPHGFRSVTVRRDRPVAWPAFADWLSAVTSLRGSDILRVQGLVRTGDRDRPVVIQGVRRMLDAPRLLPRWPSAPATALTFITTRDRPADFQRSLDAAVP